MIDMGQKDGIFIKMFDLDLSIIKLHVHKSAKIGELYMGQKGDLKVLGKSVGE